MPYVFNPLTGKLDYYKKETDPVWESEKSGYFKLDQTTPQTVENGAPVFDKGIEITKDNYIVLSE
jgi:hypothetical protein